MIKKSIYLIFLCTIILRISSFTVNEPRLFTLGDDIVELGTDIITITVSNASLDLNGHIVAGGNRGIVINPGLSGIIIRNGTVANIITDGIFIGANCNSILIENVNIGNCGHNALTIDSGVRLCRFANMIVKTIGNIGIEVSENAQEMRFVGLGIGECGNSAFQFLGTDATNSVKNILIEQVITASCCLLPTATAVFGATYGDNVFIRNSLINSCGNAAGSLSVIRFDNCVQSFGTDLSLINNDAGSVTGIDLIGSSSCIFTDVRITSHNSLVGTCTGFALRNNSFKNTFFNCGVFTCQSATSTAIGFDLQEGSNGNVFTNCETTALIGADIYGFLFSGAGTPSNTIFNRLESCRVINCRANTGICIGFDIDRADESTISNSVASDNQSVTSLAVGLRFTTMGGDEWNIHASRFVRNFGVDNANSFGIRRQTGTGNLFIQNFAFNNGTTTANQMSGVPAGSIVQLNSSNLNTSNEPWSNIVIVP